MRTTELDHKNSEVPSEQYLTNLLQVEGSLEERYMGTLEMLNLELTILGHFSKMPGIPSPPLFSVRTHKPLFP